MLIPNHPDDERLSALASRDDDAVADASLTSHLSDCARCTDVVSQLGALRASLSELPDLQPVRPLRLLPPVADAPASADGFATWVRRLFAPVVTAGTALALVGVVGTAMPSLGGMASGGADSGGAGLSDASTGAESLAFEADASAAPAAAAASDGSAQYGGEAAAASAAAEDLSREDVGQTGGESDESVSAQLAAERSPWPMVLFTGVALVVGAALLRWIIVPRAG